MSVCLSVDAVYSFSPAEMATHSTTHTLLWHFQNSDSVSSYSDCSIRHYQKIVEPVNTKQRIFYCKNVQSRGFVTVKKVIALLKKKLQNVLTAHEIRTPSFFSYAHYFKIICTKQIISHRLRNIMNFWLVEHLEMAWDLWDACFNSKKP